MCGQREDILINMINICKVSHWLSTYILWCLTGHFVWTFTSIMHSFYLVKLMSSKQNKLLLSWKIKIWLIIKPWFLVGNLDCTKHPITLTWQFYPVINSKKNFAWKGKFKFLLNVDCDGLSCTHGVVVW